MWKKLGANFSLVKACCTDSIQAGTGYKIVLNIGWIFNLSDQTQTVSSSFSFRSLFEYGYFFSSYLFWKGMFAVRYPEDSWYRYIPVWAPKTHDQKKICRKNQFAINLTCSQGDRNAYNPNKYVSGTWGYFGHTRQEKFRLRESSLCIGASPCVWG